MKKIFLTIVIAIMAIGMSACTMTMLNAEQQYGYEEQYNEDYAYLDDYAQVNWNDAQHDMQYTYYDNDRVFLVIYGNRIYVIPYDYFYHYIYPRFRMHIIWRSYDYFYGLWGHNYYNSLWSHWNYIHHRMYWQEHRNYYDNHKRNNSNRPFVIRRGQLQQPEPRYRYQIKPQPRIDGTRARIYTPRNNRATGTTNYNYVPRNERKIFVPKSDYPRGFNTPVNPSPSIRQFSPPPPKENNNSVTEEKK